MPARVQPRPDVPPEHDRAILLAAQLPDLRARGVVTVLAYKPGRRLTLRFEQADGPVILKGYRKGRSALAAKRHRMAGEALAGTCASAPPVLEHRAEQETLVLGWLQGCRPTVDEDWAPSFFSLGAALRAFQGHGTTELPRHDRETELRVIDTLAQRVRAGGTHVPAAWDQTRVRLDPVGPDVNVPLRLCHRDLHDGQLLADGARVALLDFDLLCQADPALDAANLTAHLVLRTLQDAPGSSDEGALACSRALLDGLDRNTEVGFNGQLRFYQATTFLRLSLVYALRPPWAHLTDPLVHLARRCLDDPDLL